MHKKETVISPLVGSELGIKVVVPEDFDTDRFGTFTKEIKRQGDQLHAARAKAVAAMEHTGLDLAIASEGSFVSHPIVPFLSQNIELVLLLDKKNNIEIVGLYETTTAIPKGTYVSTPQEAVDTAVSWGFPDQGVIIRPSRNARGQIYKNITTHHELYSASKTLLSRWFKRKIFIETDMRAHRCAERMKSIKEATHRLITNCKMGCPICNAPGFVPTKSIPGLMCKSCKAPTPLAKEILTVCKICNHTQHENLERLIEADPENCRLCNP